MAVLAWALDVLDGRQPLLDGYKVAPGGAAQCLAELFRILNSMRD